MHGLIFDWDNTLVNTIPVIKQSLIDTLDEFDHTGNTDEIIASAGINLSMREGFPIVFGENWESAGQFYYSRYSVHQKLITKMDGFDELIEFLRIANIPLGLNSNKGQKLLDMEIAQFELTGLFDIAIGSGTCGNDKPAPDGVYKICEKWGIKPSEDIYYIGDSDTDRKTAKNAGLSFIHINNDYGLKDLLNLIQKK